MPQKPNANKKRKLKKTNSEPMSEEHRTRDTGQVRGLEEEALQRLTESVISLTESQRQLQATVRQLVEWHPQTQRTFAQLVEGQLQLQNTVSQLAEENRRLAKVQERLQETVAQLAEENRRLAEGQERLQETVAQLAEGQERLQETVAQLVEVQQRLQVSVAQLSEESRRMMVVLKEVNRKVGRLDEQIGMTVESVAQIVLPGYLERHFGIKLKGKLGYELQPMFFRLNGEWEQVDLYGEGKMGEEEICVVCECKAKIYERDVNSFVKKLERLWGHLRKRPIYVLFGYSIHPSSQEPASSHNILLVSPLHR